MVSSGQALNLTSLVFVSSYGEKHFWLVGNFLTVHPRS